MAIGRRPTHRLGGSNTHADFFAGAGKAIGFLRSTPALCHSHPHSQRTESHNRAFLRSALQIAHDLIHIVFHPPHIVPIAVTPFHPQPARSGTSLPLPSNTGRAEGRP